MLNFYTRLAISCIVLDMLHSIKIYRRHRRSCRGGNSICECPLCIYGRLPDGTLIPQHTPLGTSNQALAQDMVHMLELGLAKSAEEARQTAQQTEVVINLGLAPQPQALPQPPAGPTVGQAVQAFLTSRAGDGKARRTLASHRNTLSYLPPSLPLASLNTPEWIEAHRSKRREVVSIETWGKELACLRAWLRWCMDRGMIATNAAKRVYKPPVKINSTLPFENEEVQALVGACQTPVERAIILTMLFTGLRESDVARLERSALGTDGRIQLHILKTGVPFRLLLNPEAQAALLALPPFEGKGSAYFFHNGQCQLESTEHYIYMTVKRLARRAGVEDAHPHRFRDTFAVGLLSSGADIRTVQLALAHESVTVTEKHYARFVPAHQRRVDEAVGRLDFGLPSTT